MWFSNDNNNNSTSQCYCHCSLDLLCSPRRHDWSPARVLNSPFFISTNFLQAAFLTAQPQPRILLVTEHKISPSRSLAFTYLLGDSTYTGLSSVPSSSALAGSFVLFPARNLPTNNSQAASKTTTTTNSPHHSIGSRLRVLLSGLTRRRHLYRLSSLPSSSANSFSPACSCSFPHPARPTTKNSSGAASNDTTTTNSPLHSIRSRPRVLLLVSTW